MSGRSAQSTVEPCGEVDGVVVASLAGAPFDPALERVRATWTAGDFGRIAVGYASGAAEFVDRLALEEDERVLDVACGTGNLTIPAALAGAQVTGIDIAANLIEAARAAAAAAGTDIAFDIGAAEALAYANNSFDTVISMFGVMFSARPEQALSELVRVTRPGGRIVLANWNPKGFIGSMLRAHTAHVPPPAGSPSTLLWGDEATMRKRLEAFDGRVQQVRFVDREIELAYPMTPAGVVELFREFYGPSVRTFGALDAQGRAALGEQLTDLWISRNRDWNGGTAVDAEYVEVQISLA